MTIRRGEDWGESVPMPSGSVEVTTDGELAAHVAGDQQQPVRLVGGDLLGSLGGPTAGPAVRRLPVDVIGVKADDRQLVAVAHVVARGRSWWRGPIVAVMNTDRIGRWDVAPRAHPNDGQLDIVEVDASMSARARWQARRRLPTGTHVPHPAIRTSRATERAWTFDPPLGLWVDGVAHGTVRSLRVVVEPDGVTVHA